MFEFIRFVRELKDKIQTVDLPGKLEDAAGYCDDAAEFLRQTAEAVRRYVGPPTVGSPAADANTAADLDEAEAALCECRAAVTAVRASGPDGVAGPGPAFWLALIDLALRVVREIRDRRNKPE